MIDEVAATHERGRARDAQRPAVTHARVHTMHCRMQRKHASRATHGQRQSTRERATDTRGSAADCAMVDARTHMHEGAQAYTNAPNDPHVGVVPVPDVLKLPQGWITARGNCIQLAVVEGRSSLCRERGGCGQRAEW